MEQKMSFKENILSKSNSYRYYKEKNIELQKEIDSLKKQVNNSENTKTLRDEYFRAYGLSGSFSGPSSSGSCRGPRQ